MKTAQTILLEGTEYVILPKAEYLRLRDRKETVPAGAVDAVAHADASLRANLRRAREAAGLTQEQLASLLGKSQAMVSGVENGRVRFSKRYVAAVLEACGLPEDWSAPVELSRKPRSRPTRSKAV
jgi:ribosome-binding protein aMBF1 (putative translation factor)